MAPAEERFGIKFPHPDASTDPDEVEQHFFDTLMTVRQIIEDNKEISDFFAGQLAAADERLTGLGRKKRDGCPDLGELYTDQVKADEIPADLT